jgi:hypothetical protein
LPVTLQNQTDAALTVDVVADDGQSRCSAAQRAARDRAGQRPRRGALWPTTENVGTAYAQIVAAAGDYADASQVQLPVYTPATTEAFAVYGT